jgi:S1-C subfamily serine protease
VEKIEPLSVEATLRTLLGTIEALSQSPQLSYQEVKEPEAGRSMSFKVSLGVVPDYAFAGNGMRIAGISDGKPAQKAGLLAGDVVVEFGGMPVRDMTSYMTALAAFTKGQKVKVVILRGQERLVKDVLL